MQLYCFSNPIRSFLNIFLLIFLSSCSSYQYSSVMTEDIYENNKLKSVNKTENTVQNIETKKSQNLYYKNAFSEKSKEYELISNENDILFTEAEQYSDANIENDSSDVKYGPWGDNKTSVTINMLGGHSFNSIHGSRSNYPSWLWNNGYGYGNVFGYGLNSWGYGYDMFWARPFHYNLHNGLFFPFWNNMGWYGYGYNYGGWPGSWYGNGYYNYNNFYSNTNVAYVSGRRSLSNLSGRSSNFSNRDSKNNYTNQSRISDKMINSSLRDRTSRVESLNKSVVAKPSYYKRPYASKPNSNWVPANSNKKPNSNDSKPSYNSKPNYNSKPSYNSAPSYNNSSSSRPSYNSSSPSRSSNSSSPSRGKGGRN